MNDDSDVLLSEDEWPEPSRKPTLREKASVLLPALIALGGIVLMLIIVLVLVKLRTS